MSMHTTPHMERVFEKYRQEGRQQMLAYLIEQGIIRESMLGAYAARLVEDQPAEAWPIIDLPKDLATWQPKEKKIA